MDKSINKISEWLKNLKDRKIEELIKDTIENDKRFQKFKLLVKVKESVAHIRGSVGAEENRDNIRNILRKQNGIFAVWDLIKINDEELKIIDIGCGGVKQYPEAIGVDQVDFPGVDVVANLENTLPFDENYADHFFAIHVLEHINNLIGLMNEIYRVLKPSGELHILAPFWKDVISVGDPTHVRFFDKLTFKYFCERNFGVKLWEPLMVSSTNGTIYADLKPVKDENKDISSELARWFY